MSPSERIPAAALIVRERSGRPYWEAVFRVQGMQKWRRVGPAWLEANAAWSAGDAPTDRWRPRRGRLQDGYYDERRAHVRAAELVKACFAEADDREAAERERRAAGMTFRELAHAYLAWLEDVRGAKPSTLRDHWSVLAEPDMPYKRGRGLTLGHVLRLLGDRPATSIQTDDVEALLKTVAGTGVGARAVNKTRAIVSACFNYGRRAHGLTQNPASDANPRREPHPGVLVFYTVEQVEALGRALEAGQHREFRAGHSAGCGSQRGGPCDCRASHRVRSGTFESVAAAEAYRRDARTVAECAADCQDAEAVRVAAYTGLRLGELLALRWRDVDFAGASLTISRALSAGVEGPPKSGRIRQVPLSDQAAAALERLSRRKHFTEEAELVFCSVLGRQLDGSALRRRFKRARDSAGLRPLRWHDLRHTFGSVLVAAGIDLASVKDAMGHSRITTTERYLHARPATERAALFTAAFTPRGGEALKPFPRAGAHTPSDVYTSNNR